MKIIGALLFIMMTSWIGYDVSSQFQNRTKEIREIIHSLQILEAEMGYSQLPLQLIFASVGKKTSQPISSFYDYLAASLDHIISDFALLWDKGLQDLKEKSALKGEELQILQQFGQNLGHYTFHQQEKHITLTIHHLEHILSEAIEQRNKYQKMVKTLGILIGIFIVLLIF